MMSDVIKCRLEYDALGPPESPIRLRVKDLRGSLVCETVLDVMNAGGLVSGISEILKVLEQEHKELIERAVPKKVMESKDSRF